MSDIKTMMELSTKRTMQAMSILKIFQYTNFSEAPNDEVDDGVLWRALEGVDALLGESYCLQEDVKSLLKQRTLEIAS